MSKGYDNLKRKSVVETSPELKVSNLGEEGLTQVAMHYLHSNIATQKEWAFDLGVSPALISMWISGDKDIPGSRTREVILKGHKYEVRQLKIIAHLQDEALKAKGWF